MKKNKKSLKLNKVMTIVLFVFSIGFLSNLANRFYRYYQNKQILHDLQEEKIRLEEESSRLSRQLELLDDENYVTRYARKYWVFTKEGEKVVTLPEQGEE